MLSTVSPDSYVPQISFTLQTFVACCGLSKDSSEQEKVLTFLEFIYSDVEGWQTVLVLNVCS